MIIDAHVHRYPEEVFENPLAFASTQAEQHWAKLVSPIGKPSLQGWANRETMLADMDEAGVEKAIMLGWYWENPKTCEIHNRWHAEWILEDPERFIAFASINPTDEQKAIDELKFARDHGFRGIGEILPAVQGFSMQDRSWLKVVEFAANEGWPINFHVSDPVSEPLVGNVPTPFEDFLWLADNYPELKIILAHFGGLLPFHELNKHFCKSSTNIFYDLAAGPLLYNSKTLSAVVEIVGSKKLLFGSDYPLRLYPNKPRQPDFKSYLSEIQSMDLPEFSLMEILGGNIAHLLEMQAVAKG